MYTKIHLGSHSLYYSSLEESKTILTSQPMTVLLPYAWHYGCSYNNIEPYLTYHFLCDTRVLSEIHQCNMPDPPKH